MASASLTNAWEAFGDALGSTPLHPQYFARRFASKVRRIAIERAKGIVADVGSGRAPYKAAIEAKSSVTRYLTIDHPEATELYAKDYALDVAADICEAIPLEDCSVDTVLLLMVLEHVPQPSAALSELHRILTPGGELILSTVMTHPVHDSPFDFYRYTRFGITRLLDTNGFELVELGWEGASVETAVTVLNTTLFQHINKLAGIKPLLPLVFVLALLGGAVAIVLNVIALDPGPARRHAPAAAHRLGGGEATGTPGQYCRLTRHH